MMFMTRLHKSEYDWQLTQEEKQDILLAWIKKVSKTAELVEKGLISSDE